MTWVRLKTTTVSLAKYVTLVQAVRQPSERLTCEQKLGSPCIDYKEYTLICSNLDMRVV